MPATLVAPLLVARLLTLDVPYVPQTDALCGGAAVAMVFRYWGDAHADVQQFAPLVDRRAHGIADTVLVDAVRQRGWTAARFDGSMAALETHLRERHPVIVLVADRRTRYHYIVVTGLTDEAVVVHDPSWGPSRAIKHANFLRIWQPTGFWSLVVLPTDETVKAAHDNPSPSVASGFSSAAAVAEASPSSPVASGFSRTNPTAVVCKALLDTAIAEIHQRGLSEADAILGRVRAECPRAAGPLRELAGVRFAERRWNEAAALAEDALALDPGDAYAADVLGSSRFMLNDASGALRAWNRIGKPRLDSVRIEGAPDMRYQLIANALGLEPNAVLTADAFERARRRVDELPDRVSARVTLRPVAEGFAIVDVVVSPRAALPGATVEWASMGVRTAIERELTLIAPGGTGQGEVWSASWRWWHERPRLAVGFAAPRVAGLPGVWRVDASWELQTYAVDALATVRESRTHGGITMTDWLNGRLRYTISAGIDSWDHAWNAASLGASIERRALRDRVAASATVATWFPSGPVARFTTIAGDAAFRSSNDLRGWVYRAAGGAQRVGNTAPFALWAGAGDGRARPPLLRAHRLLEDGIVNMESGSVFGRTLAYGTVEAQRWFDHPVLARIAIAGFVDAARATRTHAMDNVAQVDVGGGLRVKLPGWERFLRADIAHGVRDGANAFTLGWMF